ncbi:MULTISPECIES: alpha/beta hydrolase [unclassified Microbacterium]|uniref:alpha/beta hydrolase n=1 Tax=unclassified Microbacterium TaxID=2609290 RepID=UPI00364D17B2
MQTRVEFDQLSESYAQNRFPADATVQDMRDAFARGAVLPPTGVVSARRQLGGRPAIELRPEGAGDGILLYLHGGGYVLGSAETGVGMAAGLAVRTDTTAYSLEYRLGPENRFPAAVDDALAAYADLVERHGADRLLIAGDSAGGGLAVATLIAAREAGLEMPVAAAVFSPHTDLTLSGASFRGRDGDDPLFRPADIAASVRRYLPEDDTVRAARSPLASPVFADLSGLPPLLIQVGSRELLHDDALRLAVNAAHADVDVTLESAARAPHNYQTAVGRLAAADRALDRAAVFLAERLGERAVMQEA